jgi:hypothetical protein
LQRQIEENDKNHAEENACSHIQQLDSEIIIRSLSLKNQITAILMRNHSIAEISVFLNVPYSRLYTSVKEIRKKVSNILSNKEKNVIPQPENLTAQQINALPINDLMQVTNLINERLAEAKTMKEKLDDGLHLRFSPALQKEMQKKNDLSSKRA